LQRGDRCARRPVARSTLSNAGRNGGHLTNYSALAFATVEHDHDRETALAATELESSCVRELIRLVHTHHWDVDLVEGGNLQLFANPAEAELVKTHLAAAERAGVDLRDISFLDSEQLKQVRRRPGLLNAC
jgi:hypothetical protein